jgi:hypothetical protein
MSGAQNWSRTFSLVSYLVRVLQLCQYLYNLLSLYKTLIKLYYIHLSQNSLGWTVLSASNKISQNDMSNYQKAWCCNDTNGAGN